METSEKENIHFIRLQFVDINGFPKNIVIPSNRLEEALTDGVPFDASSIAGYATIEESEKLLNQIQIVLLFSRKVLKNEKLRRLTVIFMNVMVNDLKEIQNTC